MNSPSVYRQIAKGRSATFNYKNGDKFPADCKEEQSQDIHFRRLLGEKDWQNLPQAVRSRFSKYLYPGKALIYRGVLTEIRESKMGKILAQLCRLVGGPLPLGLEKNMSATVLVSEDAKHKGQIWTRIYEKKTGFPQVISSSKRFQGDTGLVEYLGFGIHMALTVRGDAKGLYFHSKRYFLKLFGLTLNIPEILSPGVLSISHIEKGGGEFDFILALRHSVFSELIYQEIRFKDDRE